MSNKILKGTNDMVEFTNKFGMSGYICPGDSITIETEGFEITARIDRDDGYTIDDDGMHNVDVCGKENIADVETARKAYYEDEWWYCGVVLSVSRNGIVLDNHAASLWGIEANYPGKDGVDNSYLLDVANELLPEAIDVGKATLATLLIGLPVEKDEGT